MVYAKPALVPLALGSETASCCIYIDEVASVTLLCGSGLPGSQPIHIQIGNIGGLLKIDG